MSGYNASLVRLTTCPNPNNGSADMTDWNETNAASSRASKMWTSFKNLRAWTCYFAQVFGQTHAGDGPPASAYFRTKPDRMSLYYLLLLSNKHLPFRSRIRISFDRHDRQFDGAGRSVGRHRKRASVVCELDVGREH